MPELVADETLTREKLKAKRNQLFQRLLKNPCEIHLAAEIKVIDDQVAKCTLQMNQKKPILRSK